MEIRQQNQIIKDITCFECGKKGHRKSEWKSQNKKATWKHLQPKSGEPTSKSVNDREYHWSGKCGRWSPSHGTNDNKDMKSKTKIEYKLFEANERDTGLYCQWNAEGSVAAINIFSN
jgi:hypothetical protein